MLPQFNKAKGLSDVVAEKLGNLHNYKKMAEGGEVDSPAEEADEFETVAAECLLAIDKRDPKLFVKAFSAFFEMCDAMPHEEGSHEGDSEGPGALLISGEI